MKFDFTRKFIRKGKIIMFEYLTAGESHGPEVTAIIKQLPAGLKINFQELNHQLARRQGGYGRGGRMKIESDQAIITSGVRQGITLGTPLTLRIKNKDWENWQSVMAIEPRETGPNNDKTNETVESDKNSRKVTKPRPGHADLPGAQKFNFRDMRNVLERASARETAARSAVGAICRQFLAEFDIRVYSHVTRIGSITSPNWLDIHQQISPDFFGSHGTFGSPDSPDSHDSSDSLDSLDSSDSSDSNNYTGFPGSPGSGGPYNSSDSPGFSDFSSLSNPEEYFATVENSPLRCGSESTTRKMKELIDAWKKKGDSVGGVFEVVITGLPPGLGSHTHWDLKLDGRLAGALMSIQAIKGVEIGAGFAGAALPGSEFHDEIYHDHQHGFYRSSNRAGGLEGGITNGEMLTVRAAMKPIPTLSTPLHSVHIDSKEETTAARERSDNCAVPAASIVGEAVSAIILAQTLVEKTGGDSMTEIKRNYNSYLEQLKNF